MSCEIDHSITPRLHFNAVKPGMRVENPDSHRKAFVLYLSNTSHDIVVRFDGFAYNSLVPANRFIVLPDEPFRP